MGFQRGTSRAPKAIVSTTRRIEGLGGKIYSFCAMYSFKISFCVVPEIFVQAAPFFSAATRYIAQIIAAGELIVIEVETCSSGNLASKVSMSSTEETATPHLPTSPSASG